MPQLEKEVLIGLRFTFLVLIMWTVTELIGLNFFAGSFFILANFQLISEVFGGFRFRDWLADPES